MPLTTISSLRIVNDPGEADRLYDVALNQVESIADSHFSGRNFTIRDLIPLDAPSSPTANEWTDSTGTDNTWDTTTLWDGTAIADDTVLCIYALSYPLPTTTAAPNITALRITIGASLRTQVSLYPILNFQSPDVNEAAHTTGSSTMGYLVTPVIATSAQIVKVEQRVVTASATHELIFHGFVAEIQGKTLEA
tara:strand:+ start:64 stop:642 length:579 start_codon:yes stop_codon:yes gene_type:complete